MTVPFNMVNSDRFRREKAACDAYMSGVDPYKKVRNDVYLIFRLDEDDTTLGCTFDRGYKRDLVVPPGQAGGLTKNTRLNKYDSAPAPNQEGGHAEELFIRSLYKLAGDHGNPGKVEVFTSLIPCMFIGGHGSNAFTIGSGKIMPKGCGAKLNYLVDLYPGIEWAFAYENDYTGKGNAIDHATKKEMLVLGGKANASVYRYLPETRKVTQITCIN